MIHVSRSICSRVGKCAAACALWIFAIAGWACAADFGVPQSPYRADIRLQTGRLALTGTVRHAGEKERIELVFEGLRAPPRPIIIRRDKGVMWVLALSERTYLETKIEGPVALAPAMGAASLAEKIEIGPEEWNGRPTVKYRVKFSPNAERQELSGLAWMSAENILVRLEGDVAGNTGAKPFSLNLENIEVGPQQDSFFEIPDGFRLVKPTLGDVGIRAPSRPGRRQSDAPRE